MRPRRSRLWRNSSPIRSGIWADLRAFDNISPGLGAPEYLSWALSPALPASSPGFYLEQRAGALTIPNVTSDFGRFFSVTRNSGPEHFICENNMPGLRLVPDLYRKARSESHHSVCLSKTAHYAQ